MVLPGIPPLPPPPAPALPGVPPPPGGGAGPDPAMLVPALANALGIPPQELAALLAQLPPPLQEEFLRLPFQEQVSLLTQLLAELGVQAAPPGQPPPMPTDDLGPPSPLPGAMPPGPGGPPPGMGAPPPPPMPGGPAPIAMMPDGSMSMMPPPPSPAPAPPAPPPVEMQLLSAQEAVGMERKRERRKVEPPPQRDLAKIKRRSPFGKTPPTIERVLDDGLAGPRAYAGRDQDIDADWEMYHLVTRRLQMDGTPTEPLAGELWHTWNKPAVVVDQIVGAVSPDPERLTIHNDPWDDTQACEESAQHIENYYRTQLERCHDLWAEKGTRGDPQPPLDRVVALVSFIEGGCGRRYFCDPDEPGMFFFEPVPLRQLYPVNGAMVRILEMTLDEARAHYQEIRDAWPARDPGKDPRRTKAYPDGDEKVRIVVWADADGLWECIAWDWSSGRDEWYAGAPRRKAAKKKQWIKEPQPIDYGVCPLQYPPLWFGSALSGNVAPAPADHTGIDLNAARPGDQRLRLRHRGGLTPLREQVVLGSQLISIIATGANLAINPPMVLKVNPNNPSDYETPDGQGKRRNPSRKLGAVSQIYVDEEFTPVPVDPTSLQNLQAMLNLVMGQAADVARPVLGGGGDAASGADRYLANASAEDHTVAPLKRYLVRWHRDALRHLGEIARRLGTGKQQLYTSLPYRAGVRTPLKDGKRPARGMGGAVLPEDFARNGADCRVRYRIEDPIRLQQLGAVYGMLLDKGAIDMYGFRDAMQVEDILQMDRRVMRDQALGDEALKKARIGQALLDYHKNGGDLTLPLLYFQERLRENQSKGSAPAPVGMGSPPAPGQPMPGSPPPGGIPGMGA